MARKFTLESILPETPGAPPVAQSTETAEPLEPGVLPPAGVLEVTEQQLADATVAALEAEAARLETEQDLAEASRLLDVSVSMGELADVVDERGEEISPTEQRLLRVAGDLAVAGTGHPGGDSVVAVESFMGTFYSAESLREKASAALASALSVIKAIWDKIVAFFTKSASSTAEAEKKAESLVATAEKFEAEGVVQVQDIDEVTLEEEAFWLQYGGKSIDTLDGLVKALNGHTATLKYVSDVLAPAVGPLLTAVGEVAGRALASGADPTKELAKVVEKAVANKNVFKGRDWVTASNSLVIPGNHTLGNGSLYSLAASATKEGLPKVQFTLCMGATKPKPVAMKVDDLNALTRAAKAYKELVEAAKAVADLNVVEQQRKSAEQSLDGLEKGASGETGSAVAVKVAAVSTMLQGVLCGLVGTNQRAIPTIGKVLGRIEAEVAKHAEKSKRGK